ncbi:MAG: RBBP9/YdeN family alpha/beta hydrolase [Acidobacteriaceae bacterium]
MMNPKYCVMIIHGTGGSPDENWFPWLTEEVRKLGHNVVTPAFQTPEGQNLTTWQAEFNAKIGALKANMVLVGHSLGAGFILNLIEGASEPVTGTFLVSGFLGKLGLERFDPPNESFVCRDFQWERIRQNAGEVHVYNSDNDPYVPLSKGKELAEKLGVELTIVHGGGHINTSAGYRSFPLLLKDLQTLLGT